MPHDDPSVGTGCEATGVAGSLRRRDMDLLRVHAFGLIIPYHASLIYNSGAFMIKLPHAEPAFDSLQMMLHPWRMLLLFVVSGVATAFIGRRMGGKTFVLNRTRKLLISLMFGMIFVVVPQAFVAIRTQIGLDVGVKDVVLAFLRIAPIMHGDEIVDVGHPQHLWFLLYLWVYTTLLLAALRGAPSVLARTRVVLLRHLQGWGLFVYPIAFFGLARLALYPVFGETLVLVTDWYSHMVYIAAFAGGYLLAFEAGIWDRMASARRVALVVALTALTVNAIEYAAFDVARVDHVNPVVRATYQWSFLVAVFGYARTYMTRPSGALAYLNRGVLTCYILHQPVMVLFAYWLHLNGWLTPASFLLVNLVTLLVCLGVYEIRRHLPLPRA